MRAIFHSEKMLLADSHLMFVFPLVLKLFVALNRTGNSEVD